MPPTTRLTREFDRLYGRAAGPLHDGAERTRVCILGLAGPSQWAPLGAVWRGVQADLELPAPAIVVNGADGLQLWFSMLEPLPAAQAQAFLEALRRRYLAELPPHRLSLLTASVPAATPALVPGAQAAEDRWSAFVAADLAPIFEDTPWLDLPPGDAGQAELLSRLQSIAPDNLARAWAVLQPWAGKPGPEAGAVDAAASSAATVTNPSSPAANPAAWQFLHQVMNDASLPLAQRIEAAKALLPFAPPA